MDKVDLMISNGEIERFNEARKRYKGKGCNKYDDKLLKPRIGRNTMEIHHFEKEEN